MISPPNADLVCDVPMNKLTCSTVTYPLRQVSIRLLMSEWGTSVGLTKQLLASEGLSGTEHLYLNG